MITKIFSIYDEATATFMLPFYSPQTASAVRLVVVQLKDTNSMLSQHPIDYTLYEMGTFDDQLGIIIPLEPMALIGKLVDYLELAIGNNDQRTLQEHMEAREQPNLHGNSS